MYAIPNTRIDIFRSVTTDQYGDVLDNDAVATVTHVPASITEVSRMVMPQNGSTPMVVRIAIGRVGANTDIQINDRIQDRKTGTFFNVTDVSSNNSPVNTPDLRLDLSRIS